MAEMGSELTTAFTIRELTGDKRTLVLRERALPYRPFELTGTQRNSIEWYPGSPIGTMQVYGASEQPTTISGAWKDKFLDGSPGNAPAEVSGATSEIVEGYGEAIAISNDVLRTARELVALVDDMRRKGQEVEVTWLNKVRRGLIDRFTEKWQTGHDVEWELAFVWISQGESLSDIAMESDSSDLGDLPNRVQSFVDKLSDNANELVPQAGDRFADVSVSMQEAGAILQQMTDELTDMVVEAAGAVTAPGEAMRRAIGILDGLKLSAELLWEIATDTADAIALDASELKSFGQTLAQRVDVRERADAATEIRNMAAREQSRLLNMSATGTLRIFQARDGQDLRDVSTTFYGGPDEWRSLMLYNRLRTSVLAAGQVVFVPARPTGDEC